MHEHKAERPVWPEPSGRGTRARPTRGEAHQRRGPVSRPRWLMGGSWAVSPKEWADGGGHCEKAEPVGQVWQWENIVVGSL